MPHVVYATRRSPLALAQSRAFAAALTGHHQDLEAKELTVTTTGDRIQDRPLADIGGKGLFVKEIEEALLRGEADFAVHSIKDVPAELPQGLLLACIPVREDPRDVLVAPRYATVQALPQHASVGTSSLRRAVCLHLARPDLAVAPLRGNVDTRLRKVDSGACDAIVLARAGLLRLGLAERATEVLSPEVVLPAVGQGALGIECRSDDSRMRALLQALHDDTTWVCVAAERAVMRALGGDCRTPLGALGERMSDGTFRLRAFVAAADGSSYRAAECVAPWPVGIEEAEQMGQKLGDQLLRA